MSQDSDLHGQVHYESHVRKGQREWAHLFGAAHKVRQRLLGRLMFKPDTRGELRGGSCALLVGRALMKSGHCTHLNVQLESKQCPLLPSRDN